MPQELSSLLVFKITAGCFLLLLFFSTFMFAKSTPISFKSSISSLPKHLQLQMQNSAWYANCPISLNELAYVELTYWGFDNQAHQGVLIVNKVLAKDVVAIFKVLYLHRFPIQKMVPIQEYNNDDAASMAANNTSSFSCRPVTGHKGLVSQHSYGRAIDINPLINPYVKKNKILPKEGAPFADRSQPLPGKITKDSIVYREFIKRGWDWGGHWRDVHDFQHFEKRANGKKRNPYGY